MAVVTYKLKYIKLDAGLRETEKQKLGQFNF